MKFEGFLYVKLGRVGTKSEGPDYWLQTRDGEYLLHFHERELFKPDFELEFYNRHVVELEGELEKPNLIRVDALPPIRGRDLGGPGGDPAAAIDVYYGEVMNVMERSIISNVDVAVDNILKIRLGSNPTTGYSWTTDTEIGDPTVVQQTSHEWEGPIGPPLVLGEPGQDVWTFKALKAGTTTITADYKQPWARGEEACTFEAIVTVYQ
ncbi:protease inhibitor I42 family protein [Mycobacterium sp. 050272]|uniref:protease inhibitor I42 family protein n=1 Tax=Mycobacterium sp. 050272 TaxID=3142488 RepID=UPI00319115D1